MTVATQKNKDDFKASYEIIEINLAMFESGKRIVYRTLSVELRKLLCDGNSSLLKKIFGNIQLHKLHSTELFENPVIAQLNSKLQHFMPGGMKKSESGHPIFWLTFTQDFKKIPLDDWLNQMFFKEGISIQDLIRSVSDKEGAHSDSNFNDALIYSMSWTWGNEQCHIMAIYGIAQYIHTFIKGEELIEKL